MICENCGKPLEINNTVCKPTFGSVTLMSVINELNKNLKFSDRIDTIEFCGFCTDICVISNAMIAKAFLPEVPVIVDASCCAGVTPGSHTNALAAMKMCQVVVENEQRLKNKEPFLRGYCLTFKNGSQFFILGKLNVLPGYLSALHPDTSSQYILPLEGSYQDSFRSLLQMRQVLHRGNLR